MAITLTFDRPGEMCVETYRTDDRYFTGPELYDLLNRLIGPPGRALFTDGPTDLRLTCTDQPPEGWHQLLEFNMSDDPFIR